MAIEKDLLGAIKSAGSTYLINNETKKVALFIPYANTCSFTLKGDKTTALASGEDAVVFPLASTLDIELGVQLLNLDILAFIANSEVGESLRKFTKREVFDITTADQVLPIKGTPLGDKVQVVTLGKDTGKSTHLSELEGATFADKGGETPGEKILTATGAKVGDVVGVYYFEETMCRNVVVKSVPEKNVNYTLDTIVSSKSSSDAGEETFLSLLSPKCNVSNDIAITFDATKASDFTIKISASKDSNNNLLEIRQVPLVEE